MHGVEAQTEWKQKHVHCVCILQGEAWSSNLQEAVGGRLSAVRAAVWTAKQAAARKPQVTFWPPTPHLHFHTNHALSYAFYGRAHVRSRGRWRSSRRCKQVFDSSHPSHANARETYSTTACHHTASPALLPSIVDFTISICSCPIASLVNSCHLLCPGRSDASAKLSTCTLCFSTVQAPVLLSRSQCGP